MEFKDVLLSISRSIKINAKAYNSSGMKIGHNIVDDVSCRFKILGLVLMSMVVMVEYEEGVRKLEQIALERSASIFSPDLGSVALMH